MGLSQISATWIHQHTSWMPPPAILLPLCSFSTLLWARAIREQPWRVAVLPAGLQPGTCFSLAPIAVTRLGRGWGRAGPDFPAARASIKEGDLFCSWQASPLITQSLQMLWQGRMCTRKGPGAQCGVGIALSPSSAPASLTTSPRDHSSFIFSCKTALLIGISPGQLKVKAKSTKLQLVKANHTILC